MPAAPPAERRPRIGVDLHTFDGIFQGSRSHLLGLYGQAVSLAPDLEFVFLLACPERLLALHPEFDAAHVQCVRMPHRNALWRLSVQLAWLQKRLQLDLLHVQYRLPFLPAGPCVCTIHDVLFETHPQFFTPNFVRMARWSSRLAVARATQIFTVSEFSRQALVDIYGVAPGRIAVTHNGVDRARFHPGIDGLDVLPHYGLAANQYLCTVGRLEPRKNHLALMRAYAELPAPRLPLIVVGQRDFSFHAVFDEVDRLGLQANVRFLDAVDDGHLPALMRHAGLFIYPSHAEGFGMPVLEAMASGVPVITSTSTSLPEVAGAAARLVPPDDVPALAAALRADLALSPQQRADRIERGLKQAACFNWRTSAQVLVDKLRQATKQPSAR